MDDQRRLSLQAGYLVCANNLRREAKLCDIILYVQGRYGTMVGYPAHKLLLISASKYFKLLFEREDLRNYCHFPHLSEEGLLAVLDIIYGREIRKETNLDDAIMVARFLQVEDAVCDLERRKECANASPSPESSPSSVRSALPFHMARSHKRKPETCETSQQASMQRSPPRTQNFKRRIKNRRPSDQSESDHSMTNTQPFHSMNSPYEHSEPDAGSNQDLLDRSSTEHLENVPIKVEPDVDLTLDDTEQAEQDLTQLSFGEGGPLFPGQLDQAFVPVQGVDDHDDQNLSQSHDGSFQAVNDQGRVFGDMTGSSLVKVEDGFHENSLNTSGQQPGDRRFPCSTCGKIFRGMRSLKQHQSIHSEDMPFECDVCGKKFRFVGNKQKHMVTHNDTRPFSCDVCGKKFKLRDHLNKHTVVHTGEKPFSCSLCGQMFSQQSNLSSHRRKCRLKHSSA